MSSRKRLSDEEIIVRYLKAKATLSSATLTSYQSLLDRFLRFCEQRSIRLLKASESVIAEFISRYEYKSTKDSYKTILNIFYKWCHKQRWIEDNPVEDIVIKGGKKNKQDLLRESDFKQIQSKCEGLREITVVSTLWYTGMRAKELRFTRIQDIDIDRGLIFVSNSKTMTGYRSIPIHPNFRKLLEKYLIRRKEIATNKPWLFLTKRGTRFSGRTLAHFIKQIQKDLPFSFSCHDFRRAFVTRLYAKTKDLVLCQRLAGHASIKTTQRYILDNIEDHMRKFNSLNF